MSLIKHVLGVDVMWYGIYMTRINVVNIFIHHL